MKDMNRQTFKTTITISQQCSELFIKKHKSNGTI